MTTEFKDCRQCFWAAVGIPIYPDKREAQEEWTCNAPDVVGMLCLDNTCIPTSYARAFTTVCGSAGRFFIQRKPGNYYVNACLREDNYDELPDELRGNAGQVSDLQEPQ